MTTAICWDADYPERSALVRVDDIEPADLVRLVPDIEVHPTLGGAQRALRARVAEVATELMARTDAALERLATLDAALSRGRDGTATEVAPPEPIGPRPERIAPPPPDAWARFTEHAAPPDTRWMEP